MSTAILRENTSFCFSVRVSPFSLLSLSIPAILLTAVDLVVLRMHTVAKMTQHFFGGYIHTPTIISDVIHQRPMFESVFVCCTDVYQN